MTYHLSNTIGRSQKGQQGRKFLALTLGSVPIVRTGIGARMAAPSKTGGSEFLNLEPAKKSLVGTRVYPLAFFFSNRENFEKQRRARERNRGGGFTSSHLPFG